MAGLWWAAALGATFGLGVWWGERRAIRRVAKLIGAGLLAWTAKVVAVREGPTP